MSRLASTLVIALAALLLPSRSAAQWPPERTKNLKVLPADIPIRALVDTMTGLTRALGVRCTYCHVGEESQPLSEYDFASDTKPAKEKARAMMRMVLAINGDHLGRLAARREPPVTVTCTTCHRGVTEPRTLQERVLAAYDAAGADSAEALYRALRERYYGRAAYDFGEVALADVATAIRSRGRQPDARRFHVLNTEVNPNSNFAHRMAASSHLAAADTAAAIASLERALTINPNDRQTARTLESLKRRP